MPRWVHSAASSDTSSRSSRRAVTSGSSPAHVEQPGRELDELLAGRVAVLPQQADLPVVVDREDDDGPRVLEHQPPERLAPRVVGAAYPVGAEREHPVVAEQVLAVLDRPPAVPVLEQRCLRAAGLRGTGLGSVHDPDATVAGWTPPA